MPLFRYDATDIAGKRRAGEIRAEDRRAALRQLERRSFTEISLDEKPEPRPPLPLGKKILFASVFLFLLAGAAYWGLHRMKAPPDMTKIYLEMDQAIGANDIGAQFEHFEKTVLYEDKNGQVRPIDRDKMKERERSMVESEQLVRNSKTTIEKVTANEDLCLVIIERQTFLGKSGALSSQVNRTKLLHVWRYQDRTWKIYMIKQLPDAD